MAKKSSRSKRTAAGRSTRGVKARTSRQAPRSEPSDAASTSAPSPEHWRYLAAVTDLLDCDEDYTTRALAKRLEMSPEALLQFQLERPDITKWANDQIEEQNRALVGPVMRKCAELAKAGSAEHAHVLIQFAGNASAGASGAGPNACVRLTGPLIVNISHGEDGPVPERP